VPEFKIVQARGRKFEQKTDQSCLEPKMTPSPSPHDRKPRQVSTLDLSKFNTWRTHLMQKAVKVPNSESENRMVEIDWSGFECFFSTA
jgi:hypothetical protein